MTILCCVKYSWETERKVLAPSYLDVWGHSTEPPGLRMPVTLAGLAGMHPLVTVHLAPLLWTSSKLTDDGYSRGKLGPSWQLSILGKNELQKFIMSVTFSLVPECVLIITVSSGHEDWSNAGVVTILLMLKLFILLWHFV